MVNNMRWRGLLLSLIGSVVLIAIGCDDVTSLQLTNATGEPVEVEYAVGLPGTFNSPGFEPDGILIGSIMPGDTVSSDIFTNIDSSYWQRRVYSIIGRAQDGRVVFRRTYDWDELKALDFTVEITQQ